MDLLNPQESLRGSLSSVPWILQHCLFQLRIRPPAGQQHMNARTRSAILAIAISLSVGACAEQRPDTDSPESIMAAAELGDVQAQARLGVMYQSGEGMSQNFTESAKWTRKAAMEGHAGAQASLGHKYQWGTGVPLNLTEAAYWYRLAAEQGHASGQERLGTLYEWGVPEDLTEAAKWYERAAEQGDASAQSSLGQLYAAGDPVKAYAWFTLAGERVVRDQLREKLTPAQITEAEELAAELQERISARQQEAEGH